VTQEYERSEEPTRAELASRLPPERPLPAGAWAAVREKLMTNAERDAVRTVRPQWLQLATAAAAGGLLVLTTGWAAGWFDDDAAQVTTADEGDNGGATGNRAGAAPLGPVPDPDHVAQTLANLERSLDSLPFELEPTPANLPLNSDAVLCVPEDGPPRDASSARADDLTVPLTEHDLRQTCRRDLGAQQAGGGESSASGGSTEVRENAPLCVVDSTSPLTDQRTADSRIIARLVDDYPLPAVALGSTPDCDGIGHPWDDELLDDINRRRTVEVAILATPDCSDLDTTVAWVEAVLADEGLIDVIDISVRDSVRDHGDACYRPDLVWQRGVVEITLG
jgi:hypothetical protein